MGKADATVQELVEMVRRGELRLPEIQRRYVWTRKNVRDLIDSLYRGYPSGTILLWQTDEQVPLQEFSVSQESSTLREIKLVLDGQQRLTSLAAVLRGEGVILKGLKKPVEILFNLEHPEELAATAIAEEASVETDESDSLRDLADEPTDDEPLPDEGEASPDELHRRVARMAFVPFNRRLAKIKTWVNVSEVFKADDIAPFLKDAGIKSFEDPKYAKYSERLRRLRDISKYTYRLDILDRSLNYAEVTEIFVRVNSLGTKLRSSDLALAQITSRWQNSLTTFQKFQEDCAKDSFDLTLGLHIRNLIAFATGRSRFDTVGTIPIKKLQASWKEACHGMEFAVNFLKQNAGIESPAVLSSPYILITVGFLGHKKKYRLSETDSAKLRKWILLANAKGRYSRGSSETILDQDLASIGNSDDPDISLLLDRLQQQFGRLDVRPADLEGRNPSSALFKTMYIAFKKGRATDWFSKLGISIEHSGKRHVVQFHHIFPKSILKTELMDADADDIANLAFIGGDTNKRIGNKVPADYIPRIVKEGGSAALQAQGIPLEPELLEVKSYGAFLSRRRELVAAMLNDFLGADSVSDNTRIREIDQEIGEIESKLRLAVGSALQGDPSLIPSHVMQKVEERLRAATRRFPYKAGEKSLQVLLENFDLREVQTLITAQAMWPRFEKIFGTKENLNGRFDQLAELRNAIRHKRPVEDVQRKDGEAAIGWFKKCLHAFC